MPLVITPNDDERDRINKAIERIERNEPKEPKLAKRARRQSLKLNLKTVETESGVARHRILRLYPEQAALIASKQPARTEVVPLAQQRDLARKEKAQAERKLELAQSYAYRLLERISLINAERKLLAERVEDLEAQLAGDIADDDAIIGTDRVIGTPSVPRLARGRPRPVSRPPA
jgi:hypothetical protein